MNIVEILKSKPIGTSLYSTVCGECTLSEVNIEGCSNIVADTKCHLHSFNGDGKYLSTGEVVLFPSKEMRDWSKFAWKKGDVLESDDGRKNVIFDSFTDDTYARFKGRYAFEPSEYLGNENCLATEDYDICTENSAKSFILLLEKRLGGKLNLETLEMEPPKPSHKYEFKPFDKVLVRNKNTKWYCDFFSHKSGNMYVCVGELWQQCLPYNEDTAKLIGTTNEYTED